MISIVRAKNEDFKLLTEIGKKSLLESHGHSAEAEIMNRYVAEKFNYDIIKEELSDLDNIYHIIYYNRQPAGYSKIIFNAAHSNILSNNVTKLERLYLLKEFYSLKLGYELLKYNIELSRNNGQEGMWLCVWIENHRAISFYTKAAFKVIGKYDFRLTDTRSNPNHQMFLEY